MTEKGQKYLADIMRAIELIKEFIDTVDSYADYCNDLKTQSAVERQLGIIGEAVNKFDQLHPEISLENAGKIVGLRNRIIQAYDSIDTSNGWVIIQKHLDPLYHELKKILK